MNDEQRQLLVEHYTKLVFPEVLAAEVLGRPINFTNIIQLLKTFHKGTTDIIEPILNQRVENWLKCSEPVPNSIKQHIPGFVSGFEPQVASFETCEELLEVEFVKSWLEAPVHNHFSDELLEQTYSHLETTKYNHIMAVSEDQLKWWVIGRTVHPVDLPIWQGGKYKVEMFLGQTTIISSDEVSSISGDWVTLRDGRQVKRARD